MSEENEKTISQEIIDQLNAWIAEDKLRKVFNKLEMIFKEDPAYYEIHHSRLFRLRNRHSAVIRDIQQNLIPPTHASPEKNKIVMELLDLVRSLQDFSPEDLFTLKENLTKELDTLVYQWKSARVENQPSILNQIEAKKTQLQRVDRLIKRYTALDSKKETTSQEIQSIFLDLQNMDAPSFHLIFQRFAELKNKSSENLSADEFREFNSISAKVIEYFSTARQEKIQDSRNLKNNLFLNEIFERILSSKRLERQDLLDLEEIRFDVMNYDKQDRSFIIMTMGLALMGRFDERKVDFLVDIISDAEEEVWQRALTVLLFTIKGNETRFRYNRRLRRKMAMLQNNPFVQIGMRKALTSINLFRILQALFNEDKGFQKGIQRITEFIQQNPKLTSFLSKPPNWFLPFRLHNTQVNQDKVPYQFFGDIKKSFILPSVLKYFLSNSMEALAKEGDFDLPGLIEFLSNEDQELLELARELGSLSFYLDLNYIKTAFEYWSFFNFYPEKAFANLFIDRDDFALTNLIDSIANKSTKEILKPNII